VRGGGGGGGGGVLCVKYPYKILIGKVEKTAKNVLFFYPCKLFVIK